MRKVSVDVTLTKMTAMRGINMQGELEIVVMYKEYTQLDNMKLIG